MFSLSPFTLDVSLSILVSPFSHETSLQVSLDCLLPSSPSRPTSCSSRQFSYNFFCFRTPLFIVHNAVLPIVGSNILEFVSGIVLPVTGRAASWTMISCSTTAVGWMRRVRVLLVRQVLSVCLESCAAYAGEMMVRTRIPFVLDSPHIDLRRFLH